MVLADDALNWRVVNAIALGASKLVRLECARRYFVVRLSYCSVKGA
jgi:hypothetical protein